jgi:hypothetical protein
MHSKCFEIGHSPILSRKESMMKMKQLDFGFMKKINKEIDIELSSKIESKLIEQMAAVLIQVNHGGKLENDDPTTK